MKDVVISEGKFESVIIAKLWFSFLLNWSRLSLKMYLLTALQLTKPYTCLFVYYNEYKRQILSISRSL